MRDKPIPFIKLSPQRWEVQNAIEQVLDSGIIMNGPFLESFKVEFAAYLNLEYVVPTANCTDALEMVLRSLELSEKDEVITSSFSWFSDASVIRLVGAQVVFCDIDLGHFGISFPDFKKKINSNTKAVILPHLFGLVHPDIHEIAKVCRERGVLLVEDCAQAHGATLAGELAGSFGDVSVFSFYPTKNLGALGDAGAIATNSKELADRCRLWGNHGQVARNEHVQLGKNSRMDELQAAVLYAKLPFLDSDNEKRRGFAAIYRKMLRDANCDLPFESVGHAYHQFVIRTDRREGLSEYLGKHGVQSDIHYPTALSDMAVFLNKASYSNATLASQTVLSLPIHPNHSEEDIQYIARLIKNFFKA